MLFSSLSFLLGFLPVSLILYFISKNRLYRNIILFVLSVSFYAWGEPKTLWLIIIVILFNYFIGIKIEEKNNKSYLLIGIIFNASLLFFFKYFNFFLVDLLQIRQEYLNIILPLGISFYTFKNISYLADIYNKKTKAEKNLLNFSNFVLMFPQFIAGPIVRYETIKNELVDRNENLQSFSNGLRRFIIGLGKKIIIANNLAIISDKIFYEVSLNELTTLLAWVGAISYTLQIYYDFSGYSDLAIGIAKMFGFNFEENFNYPYIAKTVQEFWRRWHISLSFWFRDYIYIPLGGSRVSTIRWIFNLFVVWALTGLWHGASFTFILWGLYFGIILLIEKFILKKLLKDIPIVHQILTILIFIIGWIIFNSNSIAQVLAFIKNMFIINGSFSLNALNNLGILYLWPYILIGLIGCTPIIANLLNKLNKKPVTGLMVDAYLFSILIISLILMVNSSYVTFIYFKF